MQPPNFDLSGRVALVTGGSRGIGASIAMALAASGARVFVASRKIEGCELVTGEITNDGYRAEPLACHIGKPDDIDRAIQVIRDRCGRLDILVNNAATNPYFGHIIETDLRAFDKTIEVNLRGSFFMSVAAAKLMRENNGGSILNIASVNALEAGVGQGIYSISKAAIVSMTQAFAKECAEFNIRVNALLPGLTKTRFAGALFEDEALYQQWINRVPLNRHAQPDEMAGAALYLVSDAASYTTGACLVVDGGQTI